ncbi:hypothetical protein AKO1_012119 [Acrasis kona]|uniref:Activating signal cointegrator 1 n=1 Tax=Acrasis kona TaxID=1008807 RepID=A0AAW2ZBC9_9EUKA
MNNKKKQSQKHDDFVPLPSQVQSQDPNTLIIGGMVYSVKHAKPKHNQKSQNKDKKPLTSNGVLLKQGRHECNCEGTKHLVIANCLSCGKIVCEQEGYGPCHFCSFQVQVPPTFKNQDDNTLSNKQKSDPKFINALERRNRLLQYEENFEQRTIVIDEQAVDHYGDDAETNIWLNEEERLEREEKAQRIKELKEKNEKKSGQSIRYIFDFAGRKMIEDDSQKIKEKDEVKKLIKDLKTSNSGGSSSSTSQQVTPSRTMHPSLRDIASKLVIEKEKVDNKAKQSNPVDKKKSWGRLQDVYFADQDDVVNSSDPDDETCPVEEDDSRGEPEIQYKEPISTNEEDKCLVMSMHQPYASLLVHGIKRHEGRTWTHGHTGRLWIASTSQEPTPEEIESLEHFYKSEPYCRDKGYPLHYPTSVVLGCVDVREIMPKKDYDKKYTQASEHESESDHVFICENPRRLIVPLPISGRPKIYPLPGDLVESCHSGLRDVK